MPCKLRIGLTGGIGSGKTEVSRYFSTLGAEVIDTDLVARELVEPGQPSLQELIGIFGSEILETDGSLNRAALRKIVFSDPKLRKRLEKLLHPRILQRAIAQATRSQAAYCILVVPLLIETDSVYPVERILVVDSPQKLQYARVMERDGLSREQIDAILATQVSRQRRLAAADDVIVNDGDIQSLHQAIDRFHEVYLGLSENL